MIAMATYLEQPLDVFQSSYDIQWDVHAQSWRIDAIAGDGCPLLRGNDCSVHPVKPMQCRTFPFWAELLDDRESWQAAKRYCPGMDDADGQLYSPSEIRKRAKQADGR